MVRGENHTHDIMRCVIIHAYPNINSGDWIKGMDD